MTTPTHRLRHVIDEVIGSAHPRPVTLDEIYAAVEGSISFDADDLVPPNLRGAPVGEPSWKRNVRNALQQAKRAGALVNIQHNAWRRPSPDPAFHIDPAAAWAEVHRSAVVALAAANAFPSTHLEHRYQIIEVERERLLVRRLDSEKPETVTAGEVKRAAEYLNAAGGRLGRRTVHYTVAKEVTIVHLHPRLTWSADFEWIELASTDARQPARPIYLDFDEAPNDDPAELALFALRVRAGQPRFRQNLLKAYGERCAISGWAPVRVLEAAHILLHSHTGLNEVDNGLLLRSDLHILFDVGLLRIDPETLRVWLDPSLAGTPYWDWNGTALRPREDGSHPNRDYLRLRWSEMHKKQRDSRSGRAHL